MKQFLCILMVICTSIPLAGGCGDGGLKTGNGITQSPQISLEATSSNPVATLSKSATRAIDGTLIGYDQQGTKFVVESARASVHEIEVELPGPLDCNDFDENEVDDNEFVTVSCEADSVSIEGSMVADLVNRTLTPMVPELPFPIASYTHGSVQFEPAENLPSMDPLSDITFHATGRFDYDGSERTFEFALDFSGESFFENLTGVPFGDLGETLRLQLDVASWFAALPITTCLDDGDLTLTDNHLLIADGMGGCSDVENGLKSAIVGSGELESGEDD
ncbi:MAG: hypothetical protein KDH09_17075 [Chrysiogenetes bacterium]|nr:hypothetical protein [Chrysiogenetes bacterium]